MNFKFETKKTTNNYKKKNKNGEWGSMIMIMKENVVATRMSMKENRVVFSLNFLHEKHQRNKDHCEGREVLLTNLVQHTHCLSKQ